MLLLGFALAAVPAAARADDESPPLAISSPIPGSRAGCTEIDVLNVDRAVRADPDAPPKNARPASIGRLYDGACAHRDGGIGGKKTGLSRQAIAIAVDETGALYVLDVANPPASDEVVRVFAPGASGDVEPARVIRLPAAIRTFGLAVRSGSIYLADGGVLHAYDATKDGAARELKRWSGPGFAPRLASPAVDAAQNIAIVEGSLRNGFRLHLLPPHTPPRSPGLTNPLNRFDTSPGIDNDVAIGSGLVAMLAESGDRDELGKVAWATFDPYGEPLSFGTIPLPDLGLGEPSGIGLDDTSDGYVLYCASRYTGVGGAVVAIRSGTKTPAVVAKDLGDAAAFAVRSIR